MKGTKTSGGSSPGGGPAAARGLSGRTFSHGEVFFFGEAVEGPMGLCQELSACLGCRELSQAGERLGTGRRRGWVSPHTGPAPDLLSSAEGET